MNTKRFVFFAALTAISVSANSQEAASVGNSVLMDTRAIAMQMDAKNQAVLAILQKLTTCNAKKMFYQPNDEGADDEGCIAPTSASPFVSCEGTDGTSENCDYTRLHPLTCRFGDVEDSGDRIYYDPKPQLRRWYIGYWVSDQNGQNAAFRWWPCSTVRALRLN